MDRILDGQDGTYEYRSTRGTIIIINTGPTVVQYPYSTTVILYTIHHRNCEELFSRQKRACYVDFHDSGLIEFYVPNVDFPFLHTPYDCAIQQSPSYYCTVHRTPFAPEQSALGSGGGRQWYWGSSAYLLCVLLLTLSLYGWIFFFCSVRRQHNNTLQCCSRSFTFRTCHHLSILKHQHAHCTLN